MITYNLVQVSEPLLLQLLLRCCCHCWDAVVVVEMLLSLLSVLSNLSQGLVFVDKLLTHCGLEREFFVILNTIGCGLLPKGAAFRNKEQAIFPKQALEIKIIQVRQFAHLTEKELEEQMAAKKLSIGHLWGYPRYGTVIVHSPQSTVHSPQSTLTLTLNTLKFSCPHSFFLSILPLSIHTQHFLF